VAARTLGVDCSGKLKDRRVMQRVSVLLAITVSFMMASTLTAVRAADDPPATPAAFDSAVELPASDRDAITLNVLSRNPILAASPGIKFASAYRHYPSGESAHVIFYPHADTRGVKHALQVHCNRSEPTEKWSCPIVEERRYVKLDTQEFEVRVVGDIDLDGVIALTDATRALAKTALPDGTINLVTMIYEFNGSYWVGWGSSDWREGISVQATLKDGGNAANAADWAAFLLDENGGRAE
jgi:hypothetical protein